MASKAQRSVEQQQQPPQKIQIYSSANSGISPFWRDKYEKDAKKYWDVFYKHHQDKFFKDRHYLGKEWGSYFSGAGRKVVLEVGCGVGNTIFPLIATYPEIFVHGCDFSPRAINLVKAHKDFIETRVNAFVCDLTSDDLAKQISPSSVDIVTMIFVLSAVSPEKMPLVLQNIKKVLKPNGYVLFRDYATGDLAQERLICKDQKISDNFYVRGDGTRAFYFCDEFLTSLFKENGFDIEEHNVYCKQVENRSREIVMNRRWVQAVFRVNGAKLLSSTNLSTEAEVLLKESINPEVMKEPANEFEIDMSEGMAVEMFGTPAYREEIVEVDFGDISFNIKVISNEYQHTCKSTGLMLWESARFMASVLAANPSIVSGKKVLELGCGCGGICSMVSSRSADLVVATDGDAKAIDLLTQNVISNPSLAKLIVKRLEWGNRDHINEVRESSDSGFDVIIGTDITYIPEAISPLFATARELLSSNRDATEDCEPALILCHIFRRVDEPTILSTASEFGFRLVDKWPTGLSTVNSWYQSIISAWFAENALEIPNSPLNIMYFQTMK